MLSGTRARVRGPNKEYSAPFEAAWVKYGRKQEKEESFFRWRIVAPTVGGEETLLRLCLVAFSWQEREWGPEQWKFAPYFHRYLKRRKFEDEPMPVATAPVRPVDDRGVRAVDRRVAELERYKKPDPRITAEIRALADKKAIGNG